MNHLCLTSFIKTLLSCGYRWVLVQEHTVERLDGAPLRQEDKYVPNRLVARNRYNVIIVCINLRN